MSPLRLRFRLRFRLHLRLRPVALILMSAGLLAGQAASAAESYYRFPAIRGGAVVFTAEGDLWRTGAQGGQAQRLTTHPAAETNAAISYDGKWIAFSASYEGAQEAYAMPVAGGLPKRLTFENGAVTVLGWTCLLYTSPSPRDATLSRMPSSA